MMSEPVQSLPVSSKPPMPHKRALPGAANSVSEDTSPTVEKALMLKSPPMKSAQCCTMRARRRCKREVAASRFFGDFVVNVE